MLKGSTLLSSRRFLLLAHFFGSSLLTESPAGGYVNPIIGSLSSDARHPEVSFSSLLICLDATKFVLLSVFTHIETIYPNTCSISRLKSAKSPLAVDVCCSETSLLKLRNDRF